MRIGNKPSIDFEQALEDNPIIRENIDSSAGTSTQEGAGRIDVTHVARENQGVLGDDDGLVPNDAVTNSDESGYLDGTDENTLTGNLDDDVIDTLAESSTAYPSIAGTKDKTREYDPEDTLTTEYPNNTPRLRDTPV